MASLISQGTVLPTLPTVRVPPVAAFGAPYISSLLLIIVAPLHVFARPVTCAFDIATTANKAALGTVILADVAPADVFNPKHLHHSQLSIIALQLNIAHYL